MKASGSQESPKEGLLSTHPEIPCLFGSAFCSFRRVRAVLRLGSTTKGVQGLARMEVPTDVGHIRCGAYKGSRATRSFQ